MTNANTTKLKELFADCLEIPLERVTESLRQEEVPSWDSLATAMLIPEIEEAFDVTFDVDEILELTSLEQAVRILGRKGILF